MADEAQEQRKEGHVEGLNASAWNTIQRAAGAITSQNSALLLAAAYVYFSIVGYVYDLVYYRLYNLEIIQLTKFEDLAFSVLKHWTLCLIPAILIPATAVVVTYAWCALVLLKNQIGAEQTRGIQTWDRPQWPDPQGTKLDAAFDQTSYYVQSGWISFINFFIRSVRGTGHVVYTVDKGVKKRARLLQFGTRLGMAGLIIITLATPVWVASWRAQGASTTIDELPIGRLQTSRPNRYAPNARHIGSTQSYAIFWVSGERNSTTEKTHNTSVKNGAANVPGQNKPKTALNPTSAKTDTRNLPDQKEAQTTQVPTPKKTVTEDAPDTWQNRWPFSMFSNPDTWSTLLPFWPETVGDGTVIVVPHTNVSSFQTGTEHEGLWKATETETGSPPSLVDSIKEALAQVVAATKNVAKAANAVKASADLIAGSAEETGDAIAANTAALTTSAETTSEAVAANTTAVANAAAAVIKNTGVVSASAEKTVDAFTKNTLAVVLPAKAVAKYTEVDGGGLPVTRTVFMDGSRSRTIFSLSGFEKGKNAVDTRGRDWLKGFHQSLRMCANNGRRPRVQAHGFASAEPYSPPQDSDLKNCELANARLQEAIKFLWQQETSGSFNEELLAGNCGDKIDQPESLPFKRISFEKYDVMVGPWPKYDAMIANWINHSTKTDPEDQPNFLNRTVHFIIEEAGDCENL